MDSLESIILVLIILCIFVLIKIKSNRRIEGFGLFGWIKKAVKKVVKVVKTVVKVIKSAAELALLGVQLPWLIPRFMNKLTGKARTSLNTLHGIISKYVGILERMGIITFQKAKNMTKRYFNMTLRTIKKSSLNGLKTVKKISSDGINTFKKSSIRISNELIKLFERISTKVTNLFHNQLVKHVSNWINLSKVEVKKTMTYINNTVKNSIRDIKKNAIILYNQILTDMNKNINRFTDELNNRLKLALGSTFLKIQPYMIFLSFGLFLLIGGGIFLYFSSSEESVENELDN